MHVIQRNEELSIHLFHINSQKESKWYLYIPDTVRSTKREFLVDVGGSSDKYGS